MDAREMSTLTGRNKYGRIYKYKHVSTHAATRTLSAGSAWRTQAYINFLFILTTVCGLFELSLNSQLNVHDI